MIKNLWADKLELNSQIKIRNTKEEIMGKFKWFIEIGQDDTVETMIEEIVWITVTIGI